MNIRKAIVDGVYAVGFVLYHTGTYRLIIHLRRKSAKIFVYHNVAHSENAFLGNRNVTLATTSFENQIVFLLKHYRIVELGRIVDNLKKGKCIGKYVAITFDDGYRSFKTTVLPILLKYEVPCTLFVIMKTLVDKKFLARIHLLSLLCNNLGEENLLKAIVQANHGSSKPIKNRTLSEMVYQTKKRELDFSVSVVYANYRKLIWKALKYDDLYLRRSDYSSMKENNVEYENHSNEHDFYCTLSEKECHHDFLESVKLYESFFHTRPRCFAFPAGRKAKDFKNFATLANKYGTDAFLFVSGKCIHSDTDRLALDRIHLISGEEYRIFTEIELLPFLREVREVMNRKGRKAGRGPFNKEKRLEYSGG